MHGVDSDDDVNEGAWWCMVLIVVVVVVVVEYLYSASRSASNALIVPQRCEEMCL